MRVALLLAFWSIPIISALNLQGQIKWNDLCPDIKHLKHAKVTLDEGVRSANVWRDGTFILPDVDPGTYLLTVLAHGYSFNQLRIDVSESEALPQVRPYIPGTPFDPPSPVTLPYPIILAAQSKRNFFVQEQSFNIIGMFQNPMMLMMLFTAVMALAMPTLLKNMDPDVVKKFNENQQKVAAMQSSMQNLDFGGMAGLVNDSEDSEGFKKSTPSGSGSGSKSRGGRGKRR